MEFIITNLTTGKIRKVNIDFKALGKKSVKARHKGKTKKEISKYYSNLRKNKRTIIS